MKKRIYRISIRTGWAASCFFVLLFFLFSFPLFAADKHENKYVGSSFCKPCHETQYIAFTNYARKSHSFESVQKMKKGLTDDEIKTCYGCHTTGYGKPGGFVSVEKTPELKNVGCEVCHGPGALHIKTGNPSQIIRKVTIDICRKCHIQERVQAFRYKPIIFAGSH